MKLAFPYPYNIMIWDKQGDMIHETTCPDAAMKILQELKRRYEEAGMYRAES